MLKRKFSLLFLSFALVSCSTTMSPSTVENTEKYQNDRNYKTLAVQSSASTPPLDLSKIADVNKADKKDNKNGSKLKPKEEKLNFDILPPEALDTVKGAITVIYKDNYKIRIDKKTKKVVSKNNSDISELDKVLKTNNLGVSSNLGNVFTEEEADDMQKDYKKNNKIDIPHLKSIHFYKFLEDTDTKQLSKELMKLPHVRIAYPTPKAVTTLDGYVVGNTGFNEITDSSTQDPEVKYSNGYLKSYWLNQHQSFKANNYYTTRPKPTLAFVDGGFDVQSPELNLLQGYNVTSYPVTSTTGSCGSSIPNYCVDQGNNYTTGVQAHGNMTAYVAAAKKNNWLGQGISPGSYIFPVRTDLYTPAIAEGILISANNSLVDAINVSISNTDIWGNHYLISADTSVNIAISYAVSTKNKPVAISAGNTNSEIISNNTTDAVAVGGTMPENTDTTNGGTNTGRYKAWVNPANANDGSTYHTRYSPYRNQIDMAAAAYNIYVYNYVPYPSSGPNRYYTYFSGNSLSTPMVTATLGMMKYMNSSLSAKKLKDLVIYSSTLRKFDFSGTQRIIGRDLELASINDGELVGIRDLNIYNALVLAREISLYPAVARIHNIDDQIALDQSTLANDFPHNVAQGFGKDYIYGINNMANGNYINFATYNGGGECAYGYQVFTNQATDYSKRMDLMGGVAGTQGIYCDQNAWQKFRYFTY